jgi:hypothetical protein
MDLDGDLVDFANPQTKVLARTAVGGSRRALLCKLSRVAPPERRKEKKAIYCVSGILRVHANGGTK